MDQLGLINSSRGPTNSIIYYFLLMTFQNFILKFKQVQSYKTNNLLSIPSNQSRSQVRLRLLPPCMPIPFHLSFFVGLQSPRASCCILSLCHWLIALPLQTMRAIYCVCFFFRKTKTKMKTANVEIQRILPFFNWKFVAVETNEAAAVQTSSYRFHPLRPEHSSFASFFLAVVMANCTCICIEPVVKKFVKRLTYVNVVGTFGLELRDSTYVSRQLVGRPKAFNQKIKTVCCQDRDGNNDHLAHALSLKV